MSDAPASGWSEDERAMHDDLITPWSAIITNMAARIGLLLAGDDLLSQFADACYRVPAQGEQGHDQP